MSLKICSVSELPITTFPEWEYAAADGHYCFRIEQLGKDIFISRGKGTSEREDVVQHSRLFTKIIAENMSKYESYYMIQDFSDVRGATLASRREFARWLSEEIHRIHLVIFYGMNPLMNTLVKLGKHLSPRFSNVHIVKSYEEAIHKILKHQQGESAEYVFTKKDDSTRRIHQLLGYLSKMTWLEDLNQDIAHLPLEDPYSDIFRAIEVVQADFRLIAKEKQIEHMRVLNEISKRQKVEDKLRHSEKKHSTTVNILPIAILHLGEKGNVLSTNPVFEMMMGVPTKEVLHQSIYDVISIVNLPKIKIHFHELLSQNMSFDIETPLFTNKTGEKKILRCRGIVVDKKEVSFSFIVLFGDITERKIVEKQLLDHKQRELTSSTLHLQQKNELIKLVYNEINEKIMSKNIESNYSVQKMLMKMKEIIQSETEWKDFELHFNEVHPKYYRALDQMHPGLTSQERRICAFMKMGMNSKEISRLLVTTLRGVEQHRYRIRQKFNLRSGENLFVYLSTLED